MGRTSLKLCPWLIGNYRSSAHPRKSIKPIAPFTMQQLEQLSSFLLPSFLFPSSLPFFLSFSLSHSPFLFSFLHFDFFETILLCSLTQVARLNKNHFCSLCWPWTHGNPLASCTLHSSSHLFDYCWLPFCLQAGVPVKEPILSSS